MVRRAPVGTAGAAGKTAATQAETVTAAPVDTTPPDTTITGGAQRHDRVGERLEADWIALLARGHRNDAPAELGAATGIEFLAGGRFLAAAEPVRRGAGSVLVMPPG